MSLSQLIQSWLAVKLEAHIQESNKLLESLHHYIFLRQPTNVTVNAEHISLQLHLVMSNGNVFVMNWQEGHFGTDAQ